MPGAGYSPGINYQGNIGGAVSPPIALNIGGLSPGFLKKYGGVKLGGGLPGFIPQAVNTVERDYEVEQTRFQLRNAWNNSYKRQLASANYVKPVIGSFRAINNAGDLLSRQYYSCGGSSQVTQSRPGLYGLRNSMGHIQSLCDGTGVPPATCNTKFVYDSSDFVRFLKQKAISKNYNDLTCGGDDHHSSQSAIKAVRRF
jgi:hypothetical protein